MALLRSGPVSTPAAAQSTEPPVWTVLNPAGLVPGRNFAAAAYDASAGNIVLFGGQNGPAKFDVSPDCCFSDTWVWNGSTWTQKTVTTGPPARAGAMMAYDTSAGNMVLFGGANGSGTPLSDTWVWNGSAWTEKTVTKAPPARAGAMMAYDTSAGNLVLFGGVKSGTLLNDTWVWNGSTWAEKTVTTSPPARQFATMAYDAAAGNVVLFGGANASGTPLSDTWVWNGSTWTEKTVSTSPPARYVAMMTYDDAIDRVVLFGGTDSGNNMLSDTWMWDGSTWTQSMTTDYPDPRADGVMAYDVSAGNVMLSGGQGVDGNWDDTWTLNVPLDFTFAVSGSSTASIKAGQTATYQVAIAPLYGSFPGTVSFSTSSLPQGATASISPTTISASGGAQTVTVKIATTAATSRVDPTHDAPGRRFMPPALALVILLGVARLRRRGRMLKGLYTTLILLGAVLAVGGLNGCSGSGGGHGTASESVTITATSGTIKHTTDITLKVSD